MSELLSSYDGPLRNLNYAWQNNTYASGGEAEDRGSFSSWHTDIEIPTHFQEESGIVIFWSIEFRVPLDVSKGCEIPVQMRRRPTTFYRVSSGDSDMPSSCEMKDEPEFKPLKGIPAFFLLGPLGVHSTWGRKNKVPLTYLLQRENSSWRAYGKVAHWLSQRQGISSHIEMIWGAWSFPWVAVLKLIFI